VQKKEEEKDKPQMPAHVKTFDPENPPFELQHVCIFLSELEEAKEKEE